MKSLYDSLPSWRRPVLVLLAIGTVGALAMLPRLRAVFAPEELVPLSAREAARARAMLEPFGAEGEPLLVVIEAPDVLSDAALRYQHQVATGLRGLRWIDRVEGLTVSALPHLAPVQESGITLDEIPVGEIDGGLEEAVGRVIATDPERFPLGLLSLAERNAERALIVDPLVENDVDDAEAQRVRAFVAGSASFAGRFVDRERRMAIVAAFPRGEIDSSTLEARVRETRRWLARTTPPRGVQATLAGMPEVRTSVIDALRRDEIVLVLLAILGSVLVLGLGMRRWSGVLLPLGAAGMTSAYVLGAMGAVGEPLNLLNNTIAPLLITIGIGDAVHLILRYREELAHTPDRMAAAQRTMRVMTRACFLTSATTAVGFGSLVVSETSVVRHYAITAAIGVMVSYAITMVFLPAALPSFRLEAARPRGTRRTNFERITASLAAAVARRAGAVLAIALVVLGAALLLGRHVRVDSRLADQLDPASQTRATFERVQARGLGVRRLEIGLEGTDFERGDQLRRLARVSEWIRRQPHVLRVEGPPELAAEVWRALTSSDDPAEYARSDERLEASLALATLAAPQLAAALIQPQRARIEVWLADAGERTTLRTIERIEARLARLQGVRSAVGGEAARSSRGLERLVGDLTGSVGLAMAIIFAMIGGLLRSVRLGLISMLPNVLPLAVTVAYMAARDIPLHAATTIVFSVSIGLAVDDTIHFLARYREEIGRRRGRVSAMLRSFRSSGRAAMISASTIWAGYATLMFGSFVPIRLFGELSLVALGSALACEILVLPALLVLFGPATTIAKR